MFTVKVHEFSMNLFKEITSTSLGIAEMPKGDLLSDLLDDSGSLKSSDITNHAHLKAARPLLEWNGLKKSASSNTSRYGLDGNSMTFNTDNYFKWPS